MRIIQQWSRAIAMAIGTAMIGGLPVALAQEFPSKPIRFIVPFPPGGTVDPLARLIGAKITAATGQQVIVDNRTGGSGVIGTAIAAKANPDGYTYVFAFDTHAVNPALVPNLPFDTLKDLAPVMLVGRAPYAIVTSPKRPYQSMADLVRAAKAKPDTLTYGTVGAGSLGHLALTLAQQAGGFKIVHVPYKGGGPMTAAVIGAQIDIGIGSSALVTPMVEDKRVRALAITGDARVKTLPGVPTLQEQGYKGVSAYAWWGIFTPAGIPRNRLGKMHGEIVKAINQPDVRTHLADRIGMELVISSPAELGTWTRNEVTRWAKVIRDNNIKP
ncbi:MAG: Bug family tripartite tricarboxylate transporter substrate binding protein [Burkholderiales bacterium]